MQQINLYQPEGRSLAFSFTLREILLGNLVVLLVLLAVAGNSYLGLLGLQEQQLEAAKQRDQLKKSVDQLSQKNSSIKRDPLLKDKIAKARSRASHRSKLYQLLRNQNGGDGGFSEHLASLVRQDILVSLRYSGALPSH